jgi:predicted ATPase/class 3 adenylate cyclase
MSNLPTGTITFLFTDIEGSTSLWQQHRDAMPAALARHHAILQNAIESHHGYVFQIIGDAFCAAFFTPSDALAATIEAQRALLAETWGTTGSLRVRMGLHTGVAEMHLDDVKAGQYASGLTLSRAQRIMSAGYGGQILVSSTTYELLRGLLPDGVTLRDLSEHRLKGLLNPEHLWQVVAPDLPHEFPPLQSLNAIPNDLPIQLTSFIGREKEIGEAKRLLTTTRLLTLTGSGGTGKTRLSLQVAADVLDAYKDGAWFIELAPLSDPALVPSTVASVLGVREEPGRPVIETLLDYVRAKRLLLILDNCEHLIEACARLAEAVLHASREVRILASSREALGIGGEVTLRVPSLSLPPVDAATHAAFTQSEAAQLFLDRAANALPGLVLTDANAPAVAQICRRLDGVALAIELAASRVKLLKVEQIAARLDDAFRLLTGGSRTALPRQQTLRATIDWSYNLLSDTEHTLLRRLAAFAGGWTLEAAEAVCAQVGQDAILPYDVLDLLAQLVNKSLVMAERGQSEESRYFLLETIRQYAREKLLEADEAVATRGRHLDYFMQLVEEAEPELTEANQVIWLKRLDADFDNLRSALEWSLENNASSPTG